MDFYSQRLYQEFEAVLNQNITRNSNFVIVTIPGLGVTYFIKKFIEKHIDTNLTYIDSAGVHLGEYSIVDLNFDKNENAIVVADEYFRNINLTQKIALVVNTPYLLDDPSYKKTYFASHLYQTYFFRVRSREDNDVLAKEVNPNLSESECSLIYTLSGGVGRITKYFAYNPEKIALSLEDLLKEKDLLSVLAPTTSVIARTSYTTLGKFGIVVRNEFVSSLLQKYFQGVLVHKPVNITVDKDMSIIEDGDVRSIKLLKVEKQILEEMIRNEGTITKEKVADIKWGEGSYDEYSDQAIGKTVQRLNKKLTFYELTPIRNVGYEITRR